LEKPGPLRVKINENQLHVRGAPGAELGATRKERPHPMSNIDDKKKQKPRTAPAQTQF